MNKDSLENNWKRTLEDAEINPPPQVWEKISNSLDDAQLTAQLHAVSILPEAHVWSNIEKALDQKKKRRLLFWWNSKIAAGIAAILVLVGGFGVYKALDKVDNSIKIGQKNGLSQPSAESNNAISIEKGQKSNGTSDTKERKVYGKNESTVAQIIEKNKVNKIKSIDQKVVTRKSSSISSLSLNDNGNSNSVVHTKSSLDEDDLTIAQRTSLAVDYIKRLVYDPLGVSIITTRNKLSFDYPSEKEEEEIEEKTLWLGLNSGVAPFDPNFKVNGFERAALNSASIGAARTFNSLAEANSNQKQEIFEIPLVQPYNTVQGGRAYNIGLSVEKQLKKRFSVKSGLRYLSGSSNIVSNVYSYNGQTGDLRTFWESHYISNDNSSFGENTVITKAENISNNYEFLMLPVQLAYQLPITRQLGASISTGGSMDVMFRNVIDNISRKGSNLTPINSAYKLTNFSGLAGIHLNYKLKDNWQMNIGAQMQQTITSGVDETQGFSFRPRYIGLDYSLNYRFK